MVGGVGEKYTLPLVARYADVWNVPTYALGELDHKISVLRKLCDDIGRDPDTIVMSIEAVMALAPDDASLPGVRQLAEKRFGIPAFGLHEGGLIGTPPAIVDRLHELQEHGIRTDRAVHPRSRIRRDARTAGLRGDRPALGLFFAGGE